MQDRPPITESWSRAQVAVRALRDELAAIGWEEQEIRAVLPYSDMEGRGKVRLGTVSTASAERLLERLTGRAPLLPGDVMTGVGTVDGWPTPPVPVPGCGECEALDAQRARAVEECDLPAETDARILLRRHLRAAHP